MCVAVKGPRPDVWVSTRLDVCVFAVDMDSEAITVRGVLALLQTLSNGKPAEDVAGAEIWFFGQTEIMATFDADRQKGIGYMIRALQDAARGSD